MSDRISVITATCHAMVFLRRAINAMLAQDNQNWEMIVSPDDGGDYHSLEQIDPRIRVVRSNAVRTGAGQARNRGMAIATGTYVATLDDDDTVAPNFVGEVLAALKRHDVVTVPTKYVTETGEFIRTIGDTLPTMDIPTFSRELGSMHVIGQRNRHPTWQSCFAQDVLHTCETIDRAGGSIHIVQSTRYNCTVRARSACMTRTDIDHEYGLLAEAGDSQLRMSSTGAAQTRELFGYRRSINALFENRTESLLSMGYHQFVDAECLCL